MGTQAKTNYLENLLVNAVLRNIALVSPAQVFVALFTAAPGESGGGTEVPTAGTAYARQAVTFAAPVDGATSNSADVNFPVALTAWGTITHMAIFDAVTAGNMLYYSALSSPRTVNAADQVKFVAASIQVAEL